MANRTQYVFSKVIFILSLVLFLTASEGFSQLRKMEKLNRGLVAVEATNGIFLSWRKFATEPDSLKFNVYRNDVLLTPNPIEEVSNYLDRTGDLSNHYHVEVLLNGAVIETSQSALVWEDGYTEIALQTPSGYAPNDASIADLDGDGEFEIVVKMMARAKDNSQSGITDPVFLHAYEMNGTFLWSIDLGINVRAGAHYNPFMVYDLDGDGKAEVAVKTAPGTRDATGNFLSDGPAQNDDDSADYRNSDGYILRGPEYLTLFEGKTGLEVSTVHYVPQRGNVGAWGDTYGNRVDRFLASVAYFDTLPSLVMQRGFYTRIAMAAWDYVDGELVQRWTFDTDSGGVGKDGNPYRMYEGQGSSSLTLGDVDNDGFDEIIYGSAAVDHDGVGLYSVGNYHGDASHLGDFLPDRPGLEYYMPSESAYGENLVTGERIPAVYVIDAEDGTVLWEVFSSGPADIGRAVVGNILDDHPGCEFWASDGVGMVDSDGNSINYSGANPSINFVSWWDGDLQRELLNSNVIQKWSTTSTTTLLESPECSSNNGTKATPALSGDIIGDWREEVIWRTSDNQHLRIYSTTDTTDYGFYTLLQDPQYRLALAWQNGSYNQPPHPSFFIGDRMAPLPVPNIAMVDPAIGPYLEITNPAYGYELGLGLGVYVTVNAVGFSDTTTVYLKDGTTLLASDARFPYLINLDTLNSGTYDLVAWAYDGSSNVVESSPVPITVDLGLPTLQVLAPVDSVIYRINESIPLSASALDNGGSIDSVRFYFDGTKVATLTSPPFSFNLPNPGYGKFNMYAIATDDAGNQVRSDTRTITVGDFFTVQEYRQGYCAFIIDGSIDDDNPGFTGEGFGNTENVTGSGMKWAVEIEDDGYYLFYWRYSSGSQPQRPANFTLNGTRVGATLDFEDTNQNWSSWFIQQTDSVFLSAGNYEANLISTSPTGLANIDYLGILTFRTNTAKVLDCEVLTSIDGVAYSSESDVLRMYPVPASERITIELLKPNARILRVTVFDALGKILLDEPASQSLVHVDLSDLHPGMYVVKVESKSGLVHTKSLSIQ